jgi:hypothetical protein
MHVHADASDEPPADLILRSGPKGRVSKDGQQAWCAFPSFEARYAPLRMSLVVNDHARQSTRGAANALLRSLLALKRWPA